MALLEVTGLSVAHGTIRAVRDLSFEVKQGELVALLGANGAGKTSTLTAIIGLSTVYVGSVRFDGTDITNSVPERIVRGGLTLVPEGRKVFADLTLEENLRLGAVGAGDRQATSNDELFELFPVLAERRKQLAGTLSGGEQQQLAIARALRSSPRLLLLDEPSLGLAPQVVEAIFDLLLRLRADGTTILLVEQNVHQALEVADRAYVLSSGRLHLSGTSEELLRSREINAAYLGIGAA